MADGYVMNGGGGHNRIMGNIDLLSSTNSLTIPELIGRKQFYITMFGGFDFGASNHYVVSVYYNGKGKVVVIATNGVCITQQEFAYDEATGTIATGGFYFHNDPIYMYDSYE